MFEVILFIIALVVFVRLSQKKTAWGFIVLYWAVLTVKNFVGIANNVI